MQNDASVTHTSKCSYWGGLNCSSITSHRPFWNWIWQRSSHDSGSLGLGRWWKYHKGESKSARRPEDLGTFPRQPFRLYRLISGCANNKDVQNRTPLFSKWFNYLGVGFSILSYLIVLFLLLHSHDGPHKLHRTSCAYTQIQEYAIDVFICCVVVNRQ